MCGIVGITERNPELIAVMTECMWRRGPDDHGIYVDERVSLGHRRLAVLDLSPRGHQPMRYGDQIIVYNGEVYNFREIKKELEARGDRFESESDTEVLLHAHAWWGADFLKRLNGMFALAIHDVARGQLLLARDRLGVKPLYYARQGGRWLFASEIKALLPALPSPEIDRAALVDYLTYRFVPDGKTLVRGVFRLLPGHRVRIDLASGEARFERWWEPRFSDNGLSLAENAARVRDLLRAAVRRHMISDAPLGAYLSGGLDSSAIVALMSEVSEKPVETFTVDFGDSPLSEAPFARLVAERFHCRHHEIRVEARAVDVLPELLAQLDEPIGDAAVIPTFLMARETKRHATVVLSGEGSDEIFAGYDKYKPLSLARHLPGLPRLFQTGLAGRANALFDRNPARRYRNFASVFNDAELDTLLDFDWRASDRFDPSPFFQTGDALNDLLNLDLGTWLPNDLLLKNDKMTMAHSVEARVPFLDYELVEFAATIPSWQKLSRSREKRVYREAVAPLLPRRIAARKKQGFTIPLEKWMNEGLRDYAHALFMESDTPGLRRGALEGILNEATRGVYQRRRFWTAFFYVAWETALRGRETTLGGRST